MKITIDVEHEITKWNGVLYDELIEAIDNQVLTQLLTKYKWNRSYVAGVLGISRSTLHKKLKKLK